MDYHLILFALFVLYWIGTAIFRFFKWAGRQITGTAAGANPARQALADAQRQGQSPPPSQAPPPSQKLPTRAPSLVPARPMPRQPEAGGPAVPREATDRDFRRQEEELAAWETSAFGAPLESAAPNAIPMKKLFGSSDDLIRAVILREALGPPLSRRRSPGGPPPPAAS